MNTFYSINKTNFPIIKIKLSGDITDKGLNEFFNIWLSFYDRQKHFYLLFDICEVNNPSIKHSYLLARFIQKIKKKTPQYLKKSILILNNNYILRKVMYVVFTITSPAAPLYLYWKDEYEINVNNDTIQQIFETKNELFQKIIP